jgi:hypothetical protein
MDSQQSRGKITGNPEGRLGSLVRPGCHRQILLPFPSAIFYRLPRPVPIMCVFLLAGVNVRGWRVVLSAYLELLFGRSDFAFL